MGDFLYLYGMNYKRIYDDLMTKARSENRVKGGSTYYEAHHIVPKCMGGKGTIKQWENHPNIILLTAKEHFVAHKLLVEIYPNETGLIYAYFLFVNGTNSNNHGKNKYYTIGAREYERVKLIRSKNMGELLTHTTEEFKSIASEVHGDKYDYSKVKYEGRGGKKQILIICKEHGEFMQSTSSHLLGRGCKECGKTKSLNAIIGRKLPKETYDKIGDKLRKTQEQFIKDSIKVHGDLYNYDKVNYVNASTKVTIICNKHGEFSQTPNGHQDGKGCRKCANHNNGLKVKERASNGNSPLSKYILDLETGIYYLGCEEAYNSKNFTFKKSTFNSIMSGQRTNRTSLVRV